MGSSICSEWARRWASSVRAACSKGEGAWETGESDSRSGSKESFESRLKDSPLAHVVEGEIAGHGKEPRFEARLSVVGVTALENAQPCFLYQVVDGIAPAQEVGEVADETILILPDQGMQ